MNEIKTIEQYRTIRRQNNDFAWLLSEYLSDCPRAITSSFLQSLDPDEILPIETLYIAALSGLLNLSPELNTHDNVMEQYLRKSIHCLSVEEYKGNPYYRNIHFPDLSFGRWNLTHTTYQAYEAFIYRDIILTKDFREIPQVGFFKDSFSFPAVQEDGREWMAIKPNEIETMRHAIDSVSGDVVTFGLGLGYYAYMISCKDSVRSVTIIERDASVIQLFTTAILPQFSEKEKIHIIKEDAFVYMQKTMPREHYNYAFVDLWHDAADGLPLYERIKKIEKNFPDTIFLYWVEDTLQSAWRWNHYDAISREARSDEGFFSSMGLIV